MQSKSLDGLIKKLRRLRLLRFALHISLLLICIFLIRELYRRAVEVYLFYHPILILIISGGIILFLISLSLHQYLRNNERSLASELDRQYKLKDRLMTYLELRNSNHPFLPALIHESEHHVPKVGFLRTARLQDGSTPSLILLAILALCLVTFSYWPVPPAVAASAEQHKQIKRHSEQLKKELEKIEKSTADPEIKKLAQEFLKTADQIKKPDIEPSQAFQKMNEMNQKLSDLRQKVEKEQKSSFQKDLFAMKDSANKGTSKDDQSLANEVQELQEALEKEGLSGGDEIREMLKSGKFSRQDLEKMKKSLEKYRAEKELRSQKIAELQKSLESARKGITSGKHCVTYNSALNDREVNQSKGGVEDGPGTTNKDIGPQHFNTKKKEPGGYSEDRTKAKYEQLYSGQRENVGKDPMFLGSKWNAEKSRYVRVRTFGESNEPQIIGSNTKPVAQTETESVIEKEKIPAAYRDLVRRYFESIEQ